MHFFSTKVGRYDIVLNLTFSIHSDRRYRFTVEVAQQRRFPTDVFVTTSRFANFLFSMPPNVYALYFNCFNSTLCYYVHEDELLQDERRIRIIIIYYYIITYSAPRGETSLANTTLSGCSSVVRYKPLYS